MMINTQGKTASSTRPMTTRVPSGPFGMQFPSFQLPQLQNDSFASLKSAQNNAVDHLTPSLSFTSIFSDDKIYVFHDYQRPEDEVTEDSKLSKIGLIKGITEFSCKFDSSEFIRCIDTEKQQFIIGVIWDNGVQLTAVIGINLGYHLKSPTEQQQQYHKIDKNEYLSDMLTRGMLNFQLNHGYITAQDDVHDQLISSWWLRFVECLFVDLPVPFSYLSTGTMATCKLVKQSSMPVPVGLLENLNLKIENDLMQKNDKLRSFCVISTDKTNFENYGLIYQLRDEANFSKEASDNVIKYLQFVDLTNGLTRDSIMSDNLSHVIYERSNKGAKMVTPNDLHPVGNSETSFWADPLTPMVIDPFNSTINTVNSLLPSWPSWGATAAVTNESDLPIATDTNDSEQDTPLIQDSLQDHYITDVQDSKILHLGDEKKRLVVYQATRNLYISLVFETDYVIDYNELHNLLQEQIYKYYLSDLAETMDYTRETDFQYLMTDSQNASYISSMKFIGESDREQIQLNNYMANFISQCSQTNVVGESMTKLNYKNYWCFYKVIGETQKLIILKKLVNNEQDDLKKLFMAPKKTKTREGSEDIGSDHLSSETTGFMSALGDDVLEFWRNLPARLLQRN